MRGLVIITAAFCSLAAADGARSAPCGRRRSGSGRPAFADGFSLAVNEEGDAVVASHIYIGQTPVA
jgi:hypothetical protein